MKAMKVIILSTVILALIIIILFTKCCLGVSKKDIESNARQFQDVSDNWIITQETTDTVSAMLFYPEDHSDFIYSIYLNKPGCSFGYFFRIGGTISEIENSIVEFSFEGYGEVVYVSMNKEKVNLINIDDGSKIETIKVDDASPFVVIMPYNAGNVSFHDSDGKSVDIIQRNIPK